MIKIFDTTLRDGEQSEGISFTLQDKLRITRLLDDFGMDYIEGGWPFSNPKAIEYFKEVRKLKLKHSKIIAFGSTRRAKNSAEEDANLNALIAAKPDGACIFGKTWDFHVTEALKISLEKNLELIEDSLAYLKKHFREVFFDAEHFFDGYKRNPQYAIKCLQAAAKGGADVLVLCDTNGGTLANDVVRIIREVKTKIKTPLGIHAHNDGDMAVANSLLAVHEGCIQVQGTINGYGERCGNANLCSIIPALVLKMKEKTSQVKKMDELTSLSRHVSEIVNIAPNYHQPYVGRSAFSHKGGIHVSAILKNPETYEHLDPKLVGNQQRVVVSDQSGLSNLEYKAKEFGINIDPKSDEIKKLLNDVKELEQMGYQFEEGEASFELMLRRATKKYKPFFKLMGFRIINDQQGDDTYVIEATVKIMIDGEVVHTAGEGNGPVSALDHAFRKALKRKYPQIEDMHLTDYKVRVLNSKKGTDAKVRVIVESADDHETWQTVGVSSNIIEASWNALVDSVEYKLLKETVKN
ncbi:MAG: citramalate synthase [Candidatus Margulisbacteria bacterium]|nr:citramalate synthase [Candidatus Margulisiibacteriota bacterium]